MERVAQLPQKIYRLNACIKVGYLISYPTFIGLIVSLIWRIMLNNISLFQELFYSLSICIGIFALYICVVDWNAHLEVSHEGVAYYGCGFYIYTPWQNIVGVARVKHPCTFPSYRPVNAFVFNSPALLNVPISEGKRQGRAVIEKHWLVFSTKPQTYNLCLPLISDNLANADISSHELSIYIRQYAPQVFGEAVEEA